MWIVSFMYGMYYLSLAKFFQPDKYLMAWRLMDAIKFKSDGLHIISFNNESDVEYNSDDGTETLA